MKDLKLYLPGTKKELELRGWEYVDVILFSGDAYIDHPQSGAAVIGRVLEAAGFRVALVPQPDWRGDHRDFTKLGRPRLFFAVTSGAMDSMVNHYTAAKRLRSDDAFTADGIAGRRPDRCTEVYTRIIKQHYPDVPVVIGGIEASMRRLTHYDYWEDALRPSILVSSGADLLIYGMGEKAIRQIADQINTTGQVPHDVPQTAYVSHAPVIEQEGDVRLYGFEEAKRDKRKHAENFRIIETESNRVQSVVRLIQDRVIVNPPYAPLTTEELDAIYDLPFQYMPHPKYDGHRIPAYEMIRFSVCMHRGCFGGCSFCTISAHQGKQIVSRSKDSILRQIHKISELPDYKGYISDLGGPSANMYRMEGKDKRICARCTKASCLQPVICPNLKVDFAPILDIYRTVDHLPYVKKAFVGSGIRYDLMSEEYARQVITRHVSGRLKVAPEHTEDRVVKLMRKPTWTTYMAFTELFNRINREAGLNQQLIPYFISSHPGCTNEDMRALAAWTQKMHYRPEQVQDFTPTPMTLSTTMFYTGYNPYTMEKVFVAKSAEEKKKQNSYFFWWKKH